MITLQMKKMRNVFLKIKNDVILRNRFFAFQILTMLFSIILLYSLLFSKKLSEYQIIEGNVERIGFSQMKIKPNSTFYFKSFNLINAINIQVKDSDFYIKTKKINKINLFEKIKKGDKLKIYFSIIDNYNQIAEINKNGELILSFDLNKNKKILPIILISLLFFISIVSTIYFIFIKK